MPADRPIIIAAIVLLILSTAGALARGRLGRAGPIGTWLTLALLLVMLAARWVVSGHPPIFGKFEMNLVESALVLGVGLGFASRVGRRYLAPSALFAALTLAHTMVLQNATTPVTISEQSIFVDLHAIASWFAWAFFAHAGFLAFVEAQESRAVRVLGWAFVAQTAMGFLGAYYATVLFATPWSWDPVQILGLLTWLLVGLALHLRLFFRVTLWRQRYFVAFLLLLYVASAKLVIYLPAGASFHVFELGSMAGPMPMP